MNPSLLILLPEPAPWLPTLLAALPSLVDPEVARSVHVIAPWALPDSALRLSALLPARLRAAFARRAFPRQVDVELERIGVGAAWLALEAAIAAWSGRDVGRRLAARFASRRALDALAARQLSRFPSLRMVVAPSGCAERSFAAAESRGVGRLLVEDLPSLRRLHQDLDAASAVHPEARFLRRFRARAREVARQEVERVLADRIVVRGSYARRAALDSGASEAKLCSFDIARDARPAGRGAPRSAQAVVMLAGGGAARGGLFEALAALERLAELTLVVDPGEGSEPAQLLSHPRVRRATSLERERLAGVAAVIAPAWCESYPREVARARALGVPVIATAQAAGFAPAQLARGDVDRLVAEIVSAR